jgi:hypothetical protein
MPFPAIQPFGDCDEVLVHQSRENSARYMIDRRVCVPDAVAILSVEQVAPVGAELNFVE